MQGMQSRHQQRVPRSPLPVSRTAKANTTGCVAFAKDPQVIGDFMDEFIFGESESHRAENARLERIAVKLGNAIGAAWKEQAQERFRQQQLLPHKNQHWNPGDRVQCIDVDYIDPMFKQKPVLGHIYTVRTVIYIKGDEHRPKSVFIHLNNIKGPSLWADHEMAFDSLRFVRIEPGHNWIGFCKQP
jgi:hypothetical protein